MPNQTILPRRHALTALALATTLAHAPQQIQTIDADALPVLPVKEDLRIGNADDPKLGFSAILAVDVDRDGQIYAYETQAKEIRVYARDGRKVRNIGRAGRGPGEFTRMDAIGIIGDTVWTLDNTERRVNVFRRNGNVVATKVLSALDVVAGIHNGGVAMIAPLTMRADGRFVSQIRYTLGGDDPMSSRMRSGRGVVNRTGATDTVRIPRLLFPDTGTAVDTIGWEPVPPPDAPSSSYASAVNPEQVVVQGISFTVPAPSPDGYLRTTLVDGSAIVTRRRATSKQPATFDATRFDMAGKAIHRIRFRYVPRAYEGAVLDTIAWREVNRKSEGNDAAFKAMRSALKFPAFQGPVYTIWSANDGALWMRREDNAGPRHRWIVVERSGAVRGVIEMPRSARPMWARGDVVIAVDTDDTGIPWLVRYQVRRGA